MDERQLLEGLRVARERGDRAIECKTLGDLGIADDRGNYSHRIIRSSKLKKI